MNEPTRCGFIAIIGRPNVGKSTLLNHLLQQKLSITSDKAQTTRHRIIGVHTVDNLQYVYVDTPGLHAAKGRAINRYMNQTAHDALIDVDVVLFLSEARRFTDEDKQILTMLKKVNAPVFWLLNKVDQVDRQTDLLPRVAELTQQFKFAEVIPCSAKNGDNVDKLETLLAKYLPESPFYYEETQTTDRPPQFLVAELVREKIFQTTGDELPYSAAVEIEKFELQEGVYHISALIWVEREGQKKIVIGAKGDKLKEVGMRARQDMEEMLGTKVFLQLWVKVKSGWSDDERLLKSLGYTDE
jgi:GTP-binding protein Era